MTPKSNSRKKASAKAEAAPPEPTENITAQPEIPGPPPGTGTELEAETFAEEIAQGAVENESEAALLIEPEYEVEEEPEPEPAAAPKLERLQKILAAAGVASRRTAEALIAEGRVQVNGKVATEPGTKADAARDHIRVDGKLLHGAERLRYFVLNKPKGFVTTVKDPEGRPTVMQFFTKMKERLYPVGRLDYQSEGLLLVTNDGELANRLTKASSGVEKIYLVKVAGQPTGEELDALRGGVAIDRGKPGSERVRTSPAQIRQVRQGDNPWFEVVLIEGRNRELRKMFEEVGHHVEKIRRVGYGPLALDLEPGQMRELEPEELTELRATAEGKRSAASSRMQRRRKEIEAETLPTVAPKPTRPQRTERPFEKRAGFKAQAEGGFERGRSTGSERPSRFQGERRGPGPSAQPGKFEGSRPEGERPARFFGGKPQSGPRPGRFSSERRDAGPAKRPFRRDDGERRDAGPGGRPFRREDGERRETGSAGRPFRRNEGEQRFTSRPRREGAERFDARPDWRKPGTEREPREFRKSEPGTRPGSDRAGVKPRFDRGEGRPQERRSGGFKREAGGGPSRTGGRSDKPRWENRAEGGRKLQGRSDGPGSGSGSGPGSGRPSSGGRTQSGGSRPSGGRGPAKSGRPASGSRPGRPGFKSKPGFKSGFRGKPPGKKRG